VPFNYVLTAGQSTPDRPDGLQAPPFHNPTGGHSPDVELLAEQEVVVEVSDGTVDGVAVSHLHHGRPGLTLHELHPLHVAIETEDVEDPVGVHLRRLQAVHHDNGGVGVGAVLAGRGRRGAIAGPVASPAAAPHGRSHAAALVGRGAVALVVAMVRTRWRGGTLQVSVWGKDWFN